MWRIYTLTTSWNEHNISVSTHLWSPNNLWLRKIYRTSCITGTYFWEWSKSCIDCHRQVEFHAMTYSSTCNHMDTIQKKTSQEYGHIKVTPSPSPWWSITLALIMLVNNTPFASSQTWNPNTKTKIDWDGKFYVGILLNWDSDKLTVQLSMPVYVCIALHLFQYGGGKYIRTYPTHVPHPSMVTTTR